MRTSPEAAPEADPEADDEAGSLEFIACGGYSTGYPHHTPCLANPLVLRHSLILGLGAMATLAVAMQKWKRTNSLAAYMLTQA